MKLYHGTCSSRLPKILKMGLTPRDFRNERKGNWHAAPSHGECVYLTDAYAGYFAVCAARRDRRGLVLEIDTDRLDVGDLLPDEDFLAQATRSEGETLCQTTQDYCRRLLDWLGTDTWKLSMQHLGTCAHWGAIPPSAITRYATFSPRKLGNMFDPTITLANYKFCGDKYRRLTAQLFGDPVGPPSVESVLWAQLGVDSDQFPREGVKVKELV